MGRSEKWWLRTNVRYQRINSALVRKCEEFLLTTNNFVNASLHFVVNAFKGCCGGLQRSCVDEFNTTALCASPIKPTCPAAEFVEERSQANKDLILLQTLTRFLDTERSRVRAYAVEALYHAALAKDCVKDQLVYELGVIPKLPEVLCHGTERGSLYAANLLCLLLDCPEGFVQATNSGAPEALLELAAGSSQVGVSTQALKILGRIVKYREAAGRLVNSNGHVVLIQLLLSREVSIVKRTLVVIYYLCADKVHIQYEFAKAGLIPVLLGLCSNPGKPVLYQVAEVFKVISRSSYCGRLVEAHGGVPLLEDIIASTSNEKTCFAISTALSRLRLTRELISDLTSAKLKNQVKPYELFALEYQEQKMPDVVQLSDVSVMKPLKPDIQRNKHSLDFNIAQPMLVDNGLVVDVNRDFAPVKFSRLSHEDVPSNIASYTAAPCTKLSVVACSVDFGSLHGGGGFKVTSSSLVKPQGNMWTAKQLLSHIPNSANGPALSALWQKPEVITGAEEQLVPLAAAMEKCYPAKFEVTHVYVGERITWLIQENCKN